MKPGAPFDPVEVTRELKLYPVDVVDARRELSDGPKRLYSQLFKIAVTTDRRRNPWQGFVYASEKFLSGRLGKAESGIRRDLAVLRDAGLISVYRPNKTANNQYSFRWDAAFDRPYPGGQDFASTVDDRPDLGAQISSDRPDVGDHFGSDRPDVGAHDRPDLGGLYKEEQITEATEEKAPRQLPTGNRKSSEPDRNGFSEFRSEYPAPKSGVYVEKSCRAYVGRISHVAGEHEKLMAGLGRWKVSAEWSRRFTDAPDGHLIPSMERFISEGHYLDNPPAADEVQDEDGPSCRSGTCGGRWDPITEEFLPAESAR